MESGKPPAPRDRWSTVLGISRPPGRGGVRLESDQAARQGDPAAAKRDRRVPPPARLAYPSAGRKSVTLRSRLGLVFLIGALASGSALAWVAQQRFDHWQHRALFPSCVGCHAGAEEPQASLWPAVGNCADCHDGAIQKKVDWSPPPGPRASNLKFTHSSHAAEVIRATPDSALRC